jgi:phenylalanyl-tRNA synthetase beta chain
LSEVHRLLGTTVDPAGISAAQVETILKALGCGLTAQGEANWQVTLPSWRLDLDREIDLIEEVARVYGYNRFANTLPAFAGAIRELPNAPAEARLRQTLLAAGFHEAISSTFASAEEAALTAPQPGQVVPLGNPLSAEAGVMRPSLVPGMMTMIAGNIHRDVMDVRLFELGAVFSGSTEKVEERPALSIGLTGDLPQSGPHQAGRALDFYDLKGVVEQLLSRFKTKSFYFDSFPASAGLTPAWLHPYRAARVVVEGLTMGWFGQMHPQVAAGRKLKEPVYLAQLSLDRLMALPLAKAAVREISRFQPVRRDFSLQVPEAARWAEIDTALGSSGIVELVDWHVREVLHGTRPNAAPAESKPEPEPGKDYSLLLRVTFQAPDRTLREDELQGFSQQVIKAVSALGVRLRS